MYFFIYLGKKKNELMTTTKKMTGRTPTTGELRLIAEASSEIEIHFLLLRAGLHEFRAKILPYCPDEICLKCPYFI